MHQNADARQSTLFVSFFLSFFFFSIREGGEPYGRFETSWREAKKDRAVFRYAGCAAGAGRVVWHA